MKQTFTYTVQNPVGLYAEVVEKINMIANRYTSQATLTYNNKTVNLKSMMGVLSLGIPTRAKLIFTVEGTDAREVVTALKKHLTTSQV